MSKYLTNSPDFNAKFIEMYKANTCLWNSKDAKTYCNRFLRDKAYTALLDFYKLYDSSANKDSVRSKINNLRSAFRKERNKVERAKARTGSDSYVPTLWYYNLLVFIADQNEPKNGGNDSETEDVSAESNENVTSDVVEIHEGDEEFIPQPPVIEESLSPVKKKFKKCKSDDKADALLDLVAQNLQLAQEGPLDVFGKYVASQLSELPDNMVVIAQKLINISLYEAKIGCLRSDSRIIHSGDVVSSHLQSHSTNATNVREMSRNSNKLDVGDVNLDEERLIVMVRDHPAIYDQKCGSFRDKALKEKFWKEIGTELKCSANSCRSKWETLEGSFWRAHKLVMKAKETRTKVTLWKWYSIMSFLLSSNAGRSDINADILHRRASQVPTSQEKSSKYDSASSLSLGNEDEAFFISLLPTVSRFDNDDKLDFRGEVLDTVRKIKRSKNNYCSFQSENSFSESNNDQRSFTHASSEVHDDPTEDKHFQEEHFVSIKEEADPLDQDM